jgi:hypothetical protein
VGVLAQAEDLDALVHIGIVGGAVPLDAPLATLLLVPPLRACAYPIRRSNRRSII